MRTIITTTVLGVALLAAAPHVSAFGFGGGPAFLAGRGGHGGHGGPAGMPLRLLLSQMSVAQRRQVRQILVGDRGTMRDTLQSLHAAHDALANKMLGAGPVTEADVAPDIAKIAALHQQLLEHGAKLMLELRAVATPDQLAKAADTKTKVDQLNEQLRTLLGKPGEDDAQPD